MMKKGKELRNLDVDSKYLTEYKKAETANRIWFKLTIPLYVLSLLLGATGIVIGAVRHMDWLLNLSGISVFVLPCIPIFFVFITHRTASRKMEALKKALFESKTLAEDILTLGKENGIDLFGVALEARCFHELGLKGVPEWCARDGMLPEKE